MKKLTKAQAQEQANNHIADAIKQLLGLKAGIAKDDAGKPVIIELEPATKLVITEVVAQLGTALDLTR